MLIRVFNAATATLLAMAMGCATAPKPQPQAMDSYVTTAAGRDLYRINYRGNAPASAERILDFALARASHLTDREGYRYFAVINELKSGNGEIYYYGNDELLEDHADPGSILIQAFQHRPKRIPCFRAGYLAKIVYEKYGLNRGPATL